MLHANERDVRCLRGRRNAKFSSTGANVQNASGVQRVEPSGGAPGDGERCPEPARHESDVRRVHAIELAICEGARAKSLAEILIG
jgi:hypothetical protein